MLKKPIAFHNGSSYDYHFIIKELVEFEKKTCLGENTKNYITFIVPRENKLEELIKMENKLQKTYLTNCNLLLAQDLWQAYYQILSIIFLKELIKLIENMNTMIKKFKTCGIKYSYCNCVFF